MALDIQHLNGDATFLLTFSTEPSSDSQCDGKFTILLDPWLEGDSTIFHPKFALAKRRLAPCIHHLSEMSPPNVVVVSQDKTDHCHEETLKQLEPGLPNTIILAHPAAAKRIRSWKYFDQSKVHAFPQFSDKKGNTIIRFRIPSNVPGAVAGEATLAFIPAKFDIAGVHNAIGITYRPPNLSGLMGVSSPFPSPSIPALRTVASAYEFAREGPSFFTLPPTPPESPPQSANSSVKESTRPRHCSDPEPSHTLSQKSTSENTIRPTSQPMEQSNHRRNKSSQNFSRPLNRQSQPYHSPAASDCESSDPTNPTIQHASSLPPISPAWTNTSSRSYSPIRAKALSVIFSPHGLNYAAIRPYVTSHLIQNAALPLTCLLHSFDRISNPWYLGGNVNAGSPGGLEIARNLLAKCWISAHDEDKENSGLAVLKTVMRKYTASEVAMLLEEGSDGRAKKEGKQRRVKTDVRVLEVGEHTLLP